MGTVVVVRNAAGEREVLVEFVPAYQRGLWRGTTLRIASLRTANIACKVQAHVLGQRRAGLQVDRSTQTTFPVLRGRILDDVDSADLFTGYALQRRVLYAATAAGTLARRVDFATSQQQFAI